MTSDLFPGPKQYGTILADPPWPERGGGKIKRGADRHYPLMDLTDILALWVKGEVMKAWGFRYVTCITCTEHSVKPPEFHAVIERVSAGPYLELFARRPVEGWDVWGNEVRTEVA